MSDNLAGSETSALDRIAILIYDLSINMNCDPEEISRLLKGKLLTEEQYIDLQNTLKEYED